MGLFGLGLQSSNAPSYLRCVGGGGSRLKMSPLIVLNWFSIIRKSF